MLERFSNLRIINMVLILASSILSFYLSDSCYLMAPASGGVAVLMVLCLALRAARAVFDHAGSYLQALK